MNRVLSIATLLGAAVCAHGALVNGNFETGTLDGWTSAGNVTVRNGATGTTVLENYYAYLRTDGSVGLTQLNSLFGVADIATLLGRSVKSGSGIVQTFTLEADQRIAFEWRFASNENMGTSFNDTAFALIDGIDLRILADMRSGFTADTQYTRATGYGFLDQEFQAGTHTIAFGVVNVNDSLVDSALFVEQVPEPGTYALLGSGLAALAAWRRRRRA